MNEQELQEKIALYKKELGVETDKLRRMRSQIAEQAKVKLSDLEKAIPSLEKIISEKSDEIKGLDMVIKLKDGQAKKERDSLEETYRKLESKLRTEYAKKELDLSLKANDYAKKKDLLESDKKAVKDESQSVMQRQASLLGLRAEVDNGVKQLEADRVAFDTEIKLKMSVNNTIKTDLESQKLELLAKIDEANDKIEGLNSDRSKVDSILEREKGFDSVKKSLDNRDVELEVKLDKIRQDNIASMAQYKLLNQRSRDLDKRKEELDKREDRIKTLEMKVE